MIPVQLHKLFHDFMFILRICYVCCVLKSKELNIFHFCLDYKPQASKILLPVFTFQQNNKSYLTFIRN